ncbi:hypothetical protein ARMGADRAFT_1172272 [Armillaria gallica]|uniref:Uncharacterized protein n=1 Tax=Armillaria gallica TaxID=47427 RepID=A0A2H3CMT0_ARMGA|nr:hypothetical protein ARMGADRAFT_1172272 [Armillaria gallica]
MHKAPKDLALGFRCVVSRKYDQPTLSESTYLNEDSSNDSELASVSAVLKSFCYAIEQLSGTNKSGSERRPHHPIPRNLTPIQASDNENLPVPSETLHATCAKVAQLSGAAENTDKQDRVVEDLGVNESSPEVLSGALLKSKNQPIRLVLKI